VRGYFRIRCFWRELACPNSRLCSARIANRNWQFCFSIRKRKATTKVPPLNPPPNPLIYLPDQILFKALLISKIESPSKILIRYESDSSRCEPIKQLQTDRSYGYRVVSIKPSEILEVFADKLQYNTSMDNIVNDNRLLQSLAEEVRNRVEGGKKKLMKMNLKMGELTDLVQNRDL
jgi:hypothetical protein